MGNAKHKFLAVLFLVSLLSSAILVFNDLKPLPLICDVNEGCNVVKNSPYNTIFFGIPNEDIGLAFFLVLFVLTLMQLKKPNKTKEKLITMGVFGSFIFALYSLYLQKFIIGAYCKYCTTMDISIILSLIVLFYFEKGKIFSVFRK